MARNVIVTWAEENTLWALIILALIIWGVWQLIKLLNAPKTTRIIERDIIDDTVTNYVPTTFGRPATVNGGFMGNGMTSGSGMGAGARVTGGGGRGGAL